jgi:hypothetical protein
MAAIAVEMTCKYKGIVFGCDWYPFDKVHNHFIGEE